MAGIGGSFEARYDPNLRTTTALNLPDMGGGYGGAEDWISKLLALRRQTRREGQMAGLGSAPPPVVAPEDPMRRFWTIKSDLDRQVTDWSGPSAHGQATNLSFYNMPAASALAFGKDVFPSGWDTYARLMGASGGVDPRAQASWGDLTFQRSNLNDWRG